MPILRPGAMKRSSCFASLWLSRLFRAACYGLQIAAHLIHARLHLGHAFLVLILQPGNLIS
jgi:hypothetical protein